MEKKEITEDRYNDALECLPPIYLCSIDSTSYKDAFANSEAYSHNEKGVVLAVYFIHGGKYFEAFANIKTAAGSWVQDTYEHCYRTLEAETITRQTPLP